MRSPPAPFPPPGYRRWRQDGREVVALEPVAAEVVAALESAPTLHRWARGRAERSARGGRGTIHAARLGDRLVAVRHYRRGGWMAPLLGDRYLDVVPRPFAELAVSERLRAAGVATPRVVAGIVYTAVIGHRADLATEWMEPGLPLEKALTPGARTEAERAAALRAAGEAVGRAHAAGLDHPDLNVANLLLRPEPGGGWSAAILDLDRARLREVGEGFEGRNLARLERSLRKARREGRIRWTRSDREALAEGYRAASRKE